MGWKRLGNALPETGIASLHECAIVLSLDAVLAGRIVRVRREYASAMAETQLDPHITLLYCGIRGPAEIARLMGLAERHRMREVKFGIVGTGHFADATGRITNLHYRLDSPDLHALHAGLLTAYLGEGFAPRTPYIAARYRPHISVFDRVVLRDPAAVPLPAAGPYRAGGAHLVGQRRAGR